MNGKLFLGLMSGTSIDAVDSALVRCLDNDIQLLACREHPIPEPIRANIARLSHSGDDEVERLGILDREIANLFAEAAIELLQASGYRPQDVTAIGSHGQTVRHRPPSSSEGRLAFTLQIGDPNTIAEITGVTTIADFRRRDIAAGGEGAPLAPAFHAAAFAADGINRAIINVGGIANISILQGHTLVHGCDTGPGNTLMDHWIRHHHGQSCDRDGLWAASGCINQALLQRLLTHPYLAVKGPRSTGKEAFNLLWLDAQLTQHPDISAADTMATLAEFSAASIADAIRTSAVEVAEAYVCGGGCHNRHLMQRLQHHLKQTTLDSTSALGMDPDWVEAAAFAWLASRCLAGLPGNAPIVTGASGPRVLGGIYPG